MIGHKTRSVANQVDDADLKDDLRSSYYIPSLPFCLASLLICPLSKMVKPSPLLRRGNVASAPVSALLPHPGAAAPVGAAPVHVGAPCPESPTLPYPKPSTDTPLVSRLLDVPARLVQLFLELDQPHVGCLMLGIHVADGHSANITS